MVYIFVIEEEYKLLEECFIEEFGRRIGQNEEKTRCVHTTKETSTSLKKAIGKAIAKGRRLYNRNKEYMTSKKPPNSILILLVIFFLLSSCTSVRYVPMPIESSSTSHDSVNIRDSLIYREKILLRDSFVLKDSVVTVVDDCGKILRQEYYHSKEVNRDLRQANENLQKEINELKSSKKDSVQTPVIIEKPPSRWKLFIQDIKKNILLVGGSLLFGFYIFKVRKT